MLGWDNLDTALHLDAVAKELTEHLSWPDDETDIEGLARDLERGLHAPAPRGHHDLQGTFDSPGRAGPGHPRPNQDGPCYRDRARPAHHADEGAFREALVHDLDTDGFADMYAQTIAYGLLSARIADPRRKTADDFAGHLRTNPFLRELMETFSRSAAGEATTGDQASTSTNWAYQRGRGAAR